MSAAKVDQMPPVSRVCSGPGSACFRANGVRPTATDRTERGDAQDSHQRVSPGSSLDRLGVELLRLSSTSISSVCSC